MMVKPTYYESVKRNSAKRWDQLESDPELAAPWRQLFKQVQSPRHVLSELLQNADDAGATEAFVRISNDTFTFEHNGEDFTEEHFTSLCRFGYSNKRILHTIGFRGIGFKSIFSIGNNVKLFSPSLSVCFQHNRFTEPIWISQNTDTLGGTRVVVEIDDQGRKSEVEKNLELWRKDPFSLLFFNNIRRFTIGDQPVHWHSSGTGPIPNSEKLILNDNEEREYLLIRSESEVFPDDAIEEIRSERMVDEGEDIGFDSCNIEVVLGTSGRLYVVLPTGIETKLPFACNAPFIQDPSRLKIKDPESSPTNRWLLERAGKLAAKAMLQWLRRTDLSLVERAKAYHFFPYLDHYDTSLNGDCGRVVESVFVEEIDGEQILLTEGGDLTTANKSVLVPTEILDIWTPDQATQVLDNARRPVLCRQIEPFDGNKLTQRELVKEITEEGVFNALKVRSIPKPESWRKLLKLWVYVSEYLREYRYNSEIRQYQILPVHGKDSLFASNEVVRLGEKRLLQSESDWDFLADYLLVLNQNWTRFLAEQKRIASKHCFDKEIEAVDAAYNVLDKTGFHVTSKLDEVIDNVASKLFQRESIGNRECVQLAQIAAKLQANVGVGFRFLTVHGELRPVREKTDYVTVGNVRFAVRSERAEEILYDRDGSLEYILPKDRRGFQLLHSDYTTQFVSCTKDEWDQWVSSGRAGIHTFLPFVECEKHLGQRQELENELERRASDTPVTSRYANPTFSITDWEYDRDVLEYWIDLEHEYPAIWQFVLDRILAEGDNYWSNRISATIVEIASNGNKRTAVKTGITPSWIIEFRKRKCLKDTRGKAI